MLCPDLRAHGKSEGNYVGMGWLDRKDILTWVNLARKNQRGIGNACMNL